jgi:hypothetical protein
MARNRCAIAADEPARNAQLAQMDSSAIPSVGAALAPSAKPTASGIPGNQRAIAATAQVPIGQ